MGNKPSNTAKPLLLDAAVRMFGLDPDATSKDVGRSMGHVKSAMYSHYKDKKDLVRAAYKHWRAGTRTLGEIGMDLTAWVLMRFDEKLAFDVKFERAEEIRAVSSELGCDETTARLYLAAKDGIGTMRASGEEVDGESALALLRDLIRNGREAP
jgi:AcrR family transcriptional regulator